MPKSVNCITINTDASFCNRTKIGSYAFYIITDGVRERRSGLLKMPPKNSQDAEVMAIGNAIKHILNNEEIFPSPKFLIINTDFKNAGDYIRGEKTPSSEIVSIILDELIEVLQPEVVRFKHVKAHLKESKLEARHHVNEWCDVEAKRHLRRAVKMYDSGNV